MRSLQITLAALITGISATNFAQQTHFKNTTKYLAQAKVSGRTTWNMNDTVQLISIDQFNEKGNKTEAYELYYGKRFLTKNIPGKWIPMHDTTHYSFEYDQNGWQTKQIFHNFPNQSTQSYHMFRYDQFGNIERWVAGRSFQLPHISSFTYDQYGSVLTETSCWADSCGTESMNNEIWTTDLKHYLKYNSKQMVVEDLVNYVDGMMGYQCEYTFDKAGNLISKKQYRVWSYFGLDHDIPTSKDIDRKELDHEWKFEYSSTGELLKETHIEHWMETPATSIFKYNPRGLIVELINDYSVIQYIYNEKNLVIEEKHYYLKQLQTTLKFEYAYRY